MRHAMAQLMIDAQLCRRYITPRCIFFFFFTTKFTIQLHTSKSTIQLHTTKFTIQLHTTKFTIQLHHLFTGTLFSFKFTTIQVLSFSEQYLPF